MPTLYLIVLIQSCFLFKPPIRWIIAGLSFSLFLVHQVVCALREQDVLRLLGDGSTNREIAEQLFIAEGTVKTHVTHLCDRLNLRNRAQLAIYANSVYRSSQVS